jgi:conjugative transfer signal peptidase TraF
MNRRLQQALFLTAILSGVTIAASLVAYLAGVRVNTTKSIPLGFYVTANDPVEKGAYVLFCPPPSDWFDDVKERGYIGAGFCPGGYGYLMKRVLAAKTDVVAIGSEGVRVNGVLLPLSKPLQKDKASQPLPNLYIRRLTLKANEFLLMSDVSGKSFDARYFGVITASHIQSVIRPLFTW